MLDDTFVQISVKELRALLLAEIELHCLYELGVTDWAEYVTALALFGLEVKFDKRLAKLGKLSTTS